jgi:hypothetical protein
VVQLRWPYFTLNTTTTTKTTIKTQTQPGIPARVGADSSDVLVEVAASIILLLLCIYIEKSGLLLPQHMLVKKQNHTHKLFIFRE